MLDGKDQPMKKKLIALIIVSLMLGMTSCSENSNNANESVTETSSAAASDQLIETNTDAETTSYFNDLAAQNFDGWQMNIASSGRSSTFVDYITVEEVNGEEMNDSLYNRELAIENKYNIVINDNADSDPEEDIKKSISAGTRDYAIGVELFEDISNLMKNGYLLSFTDMQLDLDMPWWDQSALDTLTINDRMYYGLSDISFDHYESCAVLFYNGVLLTDNGIEQSPYDLYLEDKWTLDAMYNMMTTVSRDVDGNGLMEEGSGDIFGLVGRDLRYQPALAASGVDILRFEESEQTYVMTITDETVMTVGAKQKQMMLDGSIALMEGDSAGADFTSGKVLFDSHLLGNFRDYRNNEDDYGIITWPTLEENMDGYVYVRNPLALFVPIDCEDIGRLSTILDALGAYSYDYVVPNYISKAVIGKGARDQQSADIIRDMMERRYYDITYAFGLDIVIDGWIRAVEGDMYASLEGRMQKAFDRVVSTSMSAFYD